MLTRTRSWILPTVVGAAVLVWAYWPTLVRMAARWRDDPQYSHGYLVPLFSLYLLWSRQFIVGGASARPSWWGIGMLVVGIGLRAAGTALFLGWFDEVSLLLCLCGLALSVGGWPALRWSAPAILFLGFMAPLPYAVQNALGGSLQRLATSMSTYALQTLGAPAIAEGNLILLNDVRIGVLEACSGLGMMMTFFALATALALVLRSTELWLRIAIVVSAIPVAILSNVVRITVTGLLYNAARDDLARLFFHDLAGLLMMPLAVMILLGEVKVLKRLVIDRTRPASPRDYAPWLLGVTSSTTGS